MDYSSKVHVQRKLALATVSPFWLEVCGKAQVFHPYIDNRSHDLPLPQLEHIREMKRAGLRERSREGGQKVLFLGNPRFRVLKTLYLGGGFES